MTMTSTIISATTIPVKTDDMSWDDFTQLIIDAYSDEEVRLLHAIPTPPMTGTPGGEEWNNQWLAQRAAADKRSTQMISFASKLILEVGKALAAAVPTFSSLFIEYAGSGDSGEACDINVYVDRLYTKDTEGNFIPWTDEENKAFHQQHEAANNILPSQLTEWLDETAWGIAYSAHPGFEIDAGGFGQIVVAPADENEEGSPLQLTISHTDRVEETYPEEVLA